MPAKGAVAARPRTVYDAVPAPVGLPRRVQTLARSRLPDLHRPRPRQLELLALDLMIAFEALVVLVLIICVG